MFVASCGKPLEARKMMHEVIKERDNELRKMKNKYPQKPTIEKTNSEEKAEDKVDNLIKRNHKILHFTNLAIC